MTISEAELQPFIIGRDHVYQVTIVFCNEMIYAGSLKGSNINCVRTGIEKFLETNGLMLGTLFHLKISGNDGYHES